MNLFLAFYDMSDGEEGAIVVFGLLILFFFGWLYVEFDNDNKRSSIRSNIKNDKVTWDDYYMAQGIEDEYLMKVTKEILDKEDYEYKKQDLNKLKNRKDIFESDIRLKSKFSIIESQLNHCNRCSSDRFRIWGLTKSSINVRCDDCKKKFNYYDEDLKNIELKDLIEDIDLLNQREEKENLNDLIPESLVEKDLFGIRSNLPPTYPFVLYSKLEPVIVRGKRNKILPEEKRSRRIAQEVKDAVWRRDEGKCIECGSNENLEFDHIIPHSKGGANTYRNIQLLCEKCNRQKSAKIG